MNIFSKYFDSHPEGMLLVTLDGRILETNPFGKELLGIDTLEKSNLNWNDFLSKGSEQEAQFFESHKHQFENRFQIELKKQNGNPFWAEVAISQPIQLPKEKFILFVRDITENKFQEEMLHFQAWHDSLTGLLNRKRMTEMLGGKIKQGVSGYLCYWDLKNFERLNRDYSHNVGDKVIISTSLKLHSLLPSNSILSRFGSDQFLVFLEGSTAEQCMEYISNTQLLFDIPFVIGDLIIHLGVATGIAKVVPGNHLSDILFQAESALKEAKKSESSHFYFFEESLLKKIELESRIFSRLPEALAKGEFTHFFQPIYSKDSRTLVGAEALVRWREPSQGYIPPDQFIPFTEKTGFILSLGSYLFEKACKTLGHWRSLGFQGKMSINLSPFQIPFAMTAEYLLDILNQNKLTGADIELELTERFLIQEGKALTDWFQSISALGISLSLDDFGTGYSSLSYLKSFPVQKVKMDKSFIQNIDSDPGKQALVSAILGLAEAFGMQTTAEGVEHERELLYLSHLPIDFLQGYYFSRPMPEEDFPSLFSK